MADAFRDRVTREQTAVPDSMPEPRPAPAAGSLSDVAQAMNRVLAAERDAQAAVKAARAEAEEIIAAARRQAREILDHRERLAQQVHGRTERVAAERAQRLFDDAVERAVASPAERESRLSEAVRRLAARLTREPHG